MTEQRIELNIRQ